MLWVLVLITWLGAGTAGAAPLDPRAVADGFAPFDSNVAGFAGTFDRKAFSNQTAPAAVGPNASVAGIPVAPGAIAGSIRVGGFLGIGGRVYTPLVGFLASPKPPAPGALQNASSTSGGATATAHLNNFAVNPSIGATASVAAGATGGAAAETIDPITVPPGIYSYTYFINGITLQSGAGDFAGVTFFAMDSRFTDPLWALGVVVEGPLNSKSDLQIAFQSQSALSTDTSGTPLDPDAIKSEVLGAFTVANGVAQLEPLELFTAFYSVDRTIQFSDGANAGAEHVPGPASAVLVGSALALLAGAARLRCYYLSAGITCWVRTSRLRISWAKGSRPPGFSSAAMPVRPSSSLSWPSRSISAGAVPKATLRVRMSS